MSKPLVVVVVSTLMLGACGHKGPEPETAASLPPATTVVVAEPAPPPPEPVPVEEPPPPAPEPLSDPQIAKVLETVDSGEIAQAKVAQKKSKNAKVKKFAAHMIQAHTKAKAKGAALAKKAKLTPEESPVSQELSSKGAEHLATLESSDAATFDEAYIAAQVQQHEEVLALIDGRLTPGATDEGLKSLLSETRTMVETHVNEAKALVVSVTPAPSGEAPSPAPLGPTPLAP